MNLQFAACTRSHCSGEGFAQNYQSRVNSDTVTHYGSVFYFILYISIIIIIIIIKDDYYLYMGAILKDVLTQG